MAEQGTSARPVWRRRAQPLLGTRVEVTILGTCETEFLRLSGLAFDRVAQHHAAMSFHEPTSDVRRIAAAAAGDTLAISADTWAVIEAAQAFEVESDGIFDVAVVAELTARGHLPALPGRALAGASASTCLQLQPGCRITVLTPIAIDLGGIAKGAAVDAALAVIRCAGAAAATVNAGGDMALFGTPARPVSVCGPQGVRVDAGTLADGAIATSGPFDAVERSSLVLHRGRQARWAERSVSVVAPTCRVADALTKVLTVLGPDAGPMLARHAAQGFSICRDGSIERIG